MERTKTRIEEIRCSSWGLFFDCAYGWQGRNLLGMCGPGGGRLWLGQSLHHSTAVYDQGRLDQSGVSVDDAAGEFVTKLRHPDEEIIWDDMTVRDAERIGLTLHSLYCQDISPQYEFSAVELRPDPLNIAVPEHGVTIRVTGQMDRSRVRADGNGIGVSDIKSGQRAVGSDGRAVTTGHWIQLGLYELLAEASLGVRVTEPAEIIGLQTTTRPRAGVGQIHNARSGLLGCRDQPGLIQMAAQMLKSGLFPPNPKSMVCHPRYCPRWSTCIYHA